MPGKQSNSWVTPFPVPFLGSEPTSMTPASIFIRVKRSWHRGWKASVTIFYLSGCGWCWTLRESILLKDSEGAVSLLLRALKISELYLIHQKEKYILTLEIRMCGGLMPRTQVSIFLSSSPTIKYVPKVPRNPQKWRNKENRRSAKKNKCVFHLMKVKSLVFLLNANFPFWCFEA